MGAAKKIQPAETEKVSVGNVSKFRLYEIDEAITSIIDMLEFTVSETGEIVDEELEQKISDRLKELTLAKDEKAANIAVYIKSLIGEAELLGKEKERLAKREKATLARADWLKRYLTAYLQKSTSEPGLAIKGVRSNISWRKSDAIQVGVVDRLPLKFKKYSVDEISEDEFLVYGSMLSKLKGLQVEPRKDALKRHIKDRQDRGHKFRHVAQLSEKYSIQIK